MIAFGHRDVHDSESPRGEDEQPAEQRQRRNERRSLAFLRGLVRRYIFGVLIAERTKAAEPLASGGTEPVA